MTKIDIFSGFLGAGKTTLIKKLLKEAYAGERVVLIENEFGEIGIDGGFLQDAGIEITEMNSGCICCSLVGDFSKALKRVLDEYKPERVLIEPSGVGKLSDVIRAVKSVEADFVLNTYTAVADAGKCKMYMKNFGEFFNDQIENASAIVLSHADKASEAKLNEAIELIKEHNSEAVIISTPIDKLDGKLLLSAIERKNTSLEDELRELEEHTHHEHCSGGHHHHEHDEECGCGHHHHHHHHADEVFTSFGAETAKKFSIEKINEILSAFDEDSDYGMILRAKGIVAGDDGEWIHFDYVPGEADVRHGTASVIGRLCVIGSKLDNEKIKNLFGV